MSVYRVAHRDAIILVPARDRIKESLLVLICELQLPGRAAIGGFIDSRTFTVADAEDICSVRVEGFDVTEVELLRSRNGHHLPRLSGVRRADHGPTGPARPDDFLIDY